MTTTTVLPNTTTTLLKNVSIKKVFVSLVFAVLVMAAGFTALYVATYPAKIGYGGDQGPFWVGLAAALIVVAFIGGARLASSNKTSEAVGVIIIAAIVLVAIGVTIWGVSLNGWDWSQFWLGVAELALVAFATSIVFVHKHVVK